MTRTLIVTNIFPPLIGGPASFADRLAHRLAERGHGVTVLCSSTEATDPADGSRPFKVVRISTRNRYTYEVNVRTALVRQLVRHRRVLVAGLEPYVLDAVRMVPRRYLLRVPGDTVWEAARNYGVTTDGFDAFQHQAKLPAVVTGVAAKRRQYLSRASSVVVPSHYLKEVVSRWPGAPDDLHVVHNGVELSDYPPRPPVDFDAAVLRVLFVGRLTNWKGVETLLLACRNLDGVEVDIVGDGPELPLLAGLQAQLACSARIRFHGRQSEHAVRSYMSANHVLALVSGYEGLSHTLLEGCAAGMIPVVSDIGGNTEVVEAGRNGLVVPYSNPSELRSALLRLKQDNGLRRRLSEGARARAAEFPFEATVRGYVELIEKQA